MKEWEQKNLVRQTIYNLQKHLIVIVIVLTYIVH